MKNALKIAAIINIIIAVLSFIITNTILYPLVLAVISIIYFSYIEKTINTLYNKKTKITLLALINFIVNPVSSIIVLIGLDKLTEEYKNSSDQKEKELTKEEKQISLLLNLGIGLISLSGIILITTKWNIITPIIKLIILVFFALLFLSLSILSNKKLKIQILEKNYWLLSMLFMILTIIANGYFEIISHWFSYNGNGKNLYIAFTTIIISLLAQITNQKYNKQIYKNISYIGILSSLAFILLQINIIKEIVLIILTMILITTNIILKQQKELSKYLTIILSIIVISTTQSSNQTLAQIILSILTIINTTYISLKGQTLEGIINPIIINTTILTTITCISTNLELNNTIQSLIILIIYSLIYLSNIIKQENKTFKIIMNIITNIIFGILLLANTEQKILLTTIAATITLTSIVNYYKKTTKEKILLPIKLTILIISIISLLKETINPVYMLILIYIIIFTIYELIKNKNIKTTCLILYYIVFILALLLNNNQQILPSFINLLASIIQLLLIDKEQNQTKTKISYITLLITVASTLIYTNILNTTQLINSALLLLIYTLLTITTTKETSINKINYLSIILPLTVMTKDINIGYELETILSTTIGMYIILLINIFLLKKTKEKNIFSTITTSLLLLQIISIESWQIGLYIGIIALILIIIGFINKEYKALLIEGIIITIINILSQFQYILKELPLWLYTLIAGLIIIGLVTYKIIDNEKK